MQLKRILARDSRTATDQAIALYGEDVLIISNHQVNGRTELVVALDVAADGGHEPTLIEPKLGATSFLDALRDAEKPRSFQPEVPIQAKEQDARDYLRGREIVDMVRDELASLRREFRLTQQTAGWQQGLQLAEDVQPLARALGDAAMPQALRSLLLDTLQDHESTENALAAFNAVLTHTLAGREADLPTQGVHVIAGPSGAGKTLMAARLARHAEQLHGAAQVALISYHDMRAGAWSQMQMLAAQLGVDCFRAGDASTLALLLNELAPRRLVLIDTPGVQMSERLAEVRATHAGAKFHAVVPADASSATLARQMGAQPWDSLFVSKLDECTQPWPLLHFLGNNSLVLAGSSDGCGAGDLQRMSPVQCLVDIGLNQLTESAGDVPEPLTATTAMAPQGLTAGLGWTTALNA